MLFTVPRMVLFVSGAAVCLAAIIAAGMVGRPPIPTVAGASAFSADDVDSPAQQPAAASQGSVAPSVTLLAAGDIASCDNNGDENSAEVLRANPGVPILALGDLAYPDGTTENFRDCFGPSWGQFKSRIRPIPGNHEYYSTNAAPYYAYFGSAAGPSTNAASRGYYSFDLGEWHIVALNSEQDFGADGAQMRWFKADLAANQNQCVLAFWHKPRFTASEEYSDILEVDAFWRFAAASGVDIVLNGHDHGYQRFTPMNADGQPSPGGLREFVVGTGGRDAHDLYPHPRREAGFSETGFGGVLQLTLSAAGYAWEFLPIAGATFADSGSARCSP